MLGCDSDAGKEYSSKSAPAIKNLKGKYIRTVRGPISSDELGFTSMHEHTLFRSMPGVLESAKIYDAETLLKSAVLSAPEPVPENFFPEEGHPITLKNRGYLQHHYPHGEKVFELSEKLMADEIADFVSIGGQSILDCSVPYERGDPNIIKNISEKTGANIIMSTGVNSAYIVPKKYKKMNVSELVAFFEKEIYEGIDNTSIVAGNIKLLVDGKSLSGADELAADGTFMKALEAASSASANTGAPVMIHSYHLSEEEFTTLLVAAKGFGMPYGRLIFSHFDTMIRELRFEEILNDPKALSLNLELGRRAMDLGSTLSFDLLGADWSNGAGLAEHNDVYALAAISQYVKEGYADSLVIGTDTWNRLSTRRFGGHGMSHLLNYIVPTLLKFGVSEQDVAKITTLNPARLLAF
jgi:phosphotriesterase-related protein